MGKYLLNRKFITTFAKMLRFVYIVLFSLCSFMFGQGAMVVENNGQPERKSVDIVNSQYAVQLECAHRYNNTAERSHSIVIPATTSSTVGTRARLQHRVDVCAEPIITVGTRVNFSTHFSLYRICCKRVIDFYLYALCCLRL